MSGMSGSGTAVSMDSSGVKFRHPTVSVVHATESLIEYYEDTDAAFDLHIELKADWNSFFREVPIPGPSGDEDDTAGSEDTTGAKYYAFGDSLPTGLKLPRDRLEEAMDDNGDRYADLNAGTGGFKGDTNAEATFWATAEDFKNTTGYGVNNNHMQTVAKGLVGLFSNSASLGNLSAENLIVIDPSSNPADISNTDPSAGIVAPADANFEIRIDQDNLRNWMSPSGEYGANVFTETQIQQLFEAMTDSGRTYMEPTDEGVDCSDLRKGTAYESVSRGMRFLALRVNDCLQVKIVVNDSIGERSADYDLVNERPNHRRWLLSLKQSDTGSFDSSQAVGSKYKNITAQA